MKADDETWLEKWLDGVRAGGGTMSQRAMAGIESRGISITRLRKAAESRGVHLLRLDDESGRTLIVASVKPFKIIC